MAIVAGHAIALFGAVWTLLCLLAGALVTDTLLRTSEAATRAEDLRDAGVTHWR
jgi:hypothetical protein